jgi:hypothetical protein
MTRRGETDHKRKLKEPPLTRKEQIEEALELAPQKDRKRRRADVEQTLDRLVIAPWAAQDRMSLAAWVAKHAEVGRVAKSSEGKYGSMLRQMQQANRAHARAGGHVALPQDVIDDAVKRHRLYVARAVMIDRTLGAGVGWSPEVNAAFRSSYFESQLEEIVAHLDRETNAARCSRRTPLVVLGLQIAREAYLLLLRLGHKKPPCSSRRNSPWHRLAAILYGDTNRNMYHYLQEFERVFLRRE